MKIRQNLPGWTRAVYIASGAGIIWACLVFVKMPLLIGMLLGGGLLAVFGLVGFCPLCHLMKRDPS